MSNGGSGEGAEGGGGLAAYDEMRKARMPSLISFCRIKGWRRGGGARRVREREEGG